jgi:hypothetical protein
MGEVSSRSFRLWELDANIEVPVQERGKKPVIKLKKRSLFSVSY